MLETYVVHLTRKCNMNCLYCYEEDKSNTYTWEEIKSLIDEIVKYNKEFNIEFFGGEPMLAFDLLKQAYRYLQRMLDVTVHNYIITTNGTILSDEVIEFLKDNPKVKWSASLDGTKYMNSFRIMKGDEVNSYDIVAENLKRLLDSGVGTNRVAVHMVTHPFNVYLLASGIDHLYSLGIRDIGVGTVETTMKIGQEYCRLFIEELDKVSLEIAKGKYPGLHVDLFETLKPRSDVRFYMFDKDGKLLAESYGRSGEDITSKGNVEARASSSPLQTMIEDIREEVYTKHQQRINAGGRNR